MTRIRFLFDEDVPPALSSGLKRRLPEHEIVWIGAPGASPKGTQDPELLAWCEEHSWLLVTLDESSMPVHFGARLQAGGHSAGVLVVPRQCEVLHPGPLQPTLAHEWHIVGRPGGSDPDLPERAYLPRREASPAALMRRGWRWRPRTARCRAE